MKCKYDLEDIIGFYEGTIPKDKFDKLTSHIESCEKCATNYKSLSLTQKFFDIDIKCKQNIFTKIENSIDNGKYVAKRKKLYLFKGLLFNKMPVIRSFAAALIILFLAIFIVRNVNILDSFKINKIADSSKLSSKSVDENTGNNSQNCSSLNIQENILSANDAQQYISQGKLAKSPDGKMSAEVVSKKGVIFDTILLKVDSNLYKIELEDKVYTSILRFDWIGNKYIGLWGHMNPSQDVYILVDPYEKKVVNNFYGLGFTWNYEKTELFFITKGPHYGEKSSSDKIVDDDGNIYYEAENGESLLDKFSVSENGENFAFFLESDNDIKLYVTKMVDNKLEKIGEFNAPYGNIEFSDRNTLSIKDESDNKLLMSCDLANINMLYGK